MNTETDQSAMRDRRGREATISLVGDDVKVTGPLLSSDRQARLFFRSILGAAQLEDGWLCRRRRLSLSELLLRINDWLESRDYELEREGEAERTILLELER